MSVIIPSSLTGGFLTNINTSPTVLGPALPDFSLFPAGTLTGIRSGSITNPLLGVIGEGGTSGFLFADQLKALGFINPITGKNAQGVSIVPPSFEGQFPDISGAISGAFAKIAASFQSIGVSSGLTTQAPTTSRAEGEQTTTDPTFTDTLGAGFGGITKALGPTGLLVGAGILGILLLKR